MDLNTIYESVIFEKSLPVVLDNMALYLEKALVLVDTGFRVLAHSTAYSVRDNEWVKSITAGFCDYDMVLEFHAQVSSAPVRDSSPFIISVC